MEPDDIVEMIQEVFDEYEELDFNENTYCEYEDDDDDHAFRSAGWGTDDSYGYFGEDEY